MARKVPPEDLVVAAITKVLAENGVVTSQGRLRSLVAEELAAFDGDYTVSADRARQLAVRKGVARIEIHARRGEHRTLESCPVCSSRLSKVKNRTLDGSEVHVGVKCKRCGFWVGQKGRVPSRYVFYDRRRKVGRKAVRGRRGVGQLGGR
ncbi:MAG: hypothetical protein HY556_06405 [Euryarchaeota archaeon]|nr:hypothetical protein [Euryarchaeota archaeon]